MHLISLCIVIFLQRTKGMIHFVRNFEKSDFILHSQKVLFIPPYLVILFSSLYGEVQMNKFEHV